MLKKLFSLFMFGFVVTLPMAPVDAEAAPVDFYRTVSGNYFVSGAQIGTYEAAIHYNTNPADLELYNPGSFEAGYKPYSLYQDKFYISMTYFLGVNAPAGFANRSFTEAPLFINDFIVMNDFEFSFSNPQDQLLIEASRVNPDSSISNLSFRFRTGPDALSSTSISDILEGNAEGVFNCGPTTECQLSSTLFGFPIGLGDGGVTSVGPIIEYVPEPGTLALAGLALAGLVSIRRR